MDPSYHLDEAEYPATPADGSLESVMINQILLARKQSTAGGNIKVKERVFCQVEGCEHYNLAEWQCNCSIAGRPLGCDRLVCDEHCVKFSRQHPFGF